MAWIGVRYGKSQSEVEQWNFGTESSGEDLGFQKHSCLQFCILDDSFEINLFHAVKNDAFDREYLHENIERLSPKIIKAIADLKGKGYRWEIYDSEEDERYKFDFDTQDSNEFIAFYKNNDQRGRESYLMLNFRPDDEVLKDVRTIGNMIIENFMELLPLYNLLKFSTNK